MSEQQTPTPIEPADIQPGDVVRITRDVAVNDVVPKAGGEAWINGMWVVGPGEAHLVHRPDPDAEAVEALAKVMHDDRCSDECCDGCDMGDYEHDAERIIHSARDRGWDVVRRAES